MQPEQKRYLALRWLPPIIITLICLALLGYKSPDPLILSRYSLFQSLLVATMALWAGVWWLIVLDQNRVQHLWSRLRQWPVVSLVVLAIGVLIALDVLRLLDLIVVASFSPILLAGVTWLLAVAKPQELVGRLALVTGSLLVTFIVLEILFRIVLLESQVPANEQKFTKWIASTWPRPIPVEKAPGTFRILGLSDSFGRAGRNENYHYLLETRLQNDGLNVEVINISLSGYEPPDELAILSRFGARYQPDLVLHGFFVGNDFSVPAGQPVIFRGINLRTKPGLISWQPRNSLLLQWLYRYLIVLRDRALRETENDAQAPSGTISMEGYLRTEWRRLPDLCKFDPPPDVRWQGTVVVLDQIRREVDRIGAAYVMVIHPDRFQVEVKLRQQLEDRYHLDLDACDLELPQKFLGNYCTTRGIPCLDLLPIFKDNGAEGGLYLFRDTHYNKAGNTLTSREISDFLMERYTLDLEQHRSE